MSFRNRIFVLILPLGAGVLFAPLTALAHAFGQQYNLPLPASFYIFGGVCAFIASSVIITLFGDPSERDEPSTQVKVVSLPRFVIGTLAVIGLLLLCFFMAVSFWGSQQWFENPAPTLFWVYLLLGGAYFSVFVSEWWRLLNPFRTMAKIAIGGEDPIFTYPAWLSYTPAIVFFGVLIWIELFSNGLAAVPAILGIMVLIYAFAMVAGSQVFGIESWFSHGDFFTVFFGVLGLCAPISVDDQRIKLRRLRGRLIRDSASHIALVIFILLMLASTALDGLRDTVPWNRFLYYVLPRLGIHTSSSLLGTVGLIVVPLLFFCLYSLAIIFSRLLTRSSIPLRTFLLRFGYSLVPIAIAYHFAHYFDLLIGEGQRLIPLLADPFALGWNILSLKAFSPNYIPIAANYIWYIQLSVIVIGHTIAAFISHRIALRTFANKREVIVSQIPMLILMVFYTALGLWILSQPYSV